MKKHYLPIFLALICYAVSGKDYKPSYGVCAKVSQYPAIQKAGYTYVEPSVRDFLVPDKSDADFSANLAEQKRL